MKKYLPLALFLGFAFIVFFAFLEGRPSPKNARIYKTVQKYSPYYLDKRLGGLQIMNKEDSDFKEKPTNKTLFKEFERLEKEWGEKHLNIKDNSLIIVDKNGTTLKELTIQNKNEMAFIHTYYGI